MSKLKRLLTLISLFFLSAISRGQEGENKVEMADTMRSNGRIYVVVAVVVTILIGLILYLIRLDKKITNLEKEK